MSQENQRPFRKADLENPDYRDKLLRKLNCLIAVLEVAKAKVVRSISSADDIEEDKEDRLARIQANLGSTLDVCQRAKRAIELRGLSHDGLPDGFPTSASDIRAGGGLPRGAFVEMTSPEEYQRFSLLGAITQAQIASCDLDELSQRLQA